MTTVINDLKVFARVENNTILEYPVYALHIKNRAHPFDWYQEVTFDTIPEVPAFHYAREVPSLTVFGKVHVTYQIEAHNLNSLLNQIYPNAADMGAVVEPVAIETLAPELIARVVELVKQHVQLKLDQFAQTRSYDGVVSAISYLQSTVPGFVNDAQRMVTLRDQTWQNLYAYLAEVTAGTKPVPKSIREIEAELPELTWE